jgi:hypothetical protein
LFCHDLFDSVLYSQIDLHKPTSSSNGSTIYFGAYTFFEQVLFAVVDPAFALRQGPGFCPRTRGCVQNSQRSGAKEPLEGSYSAAESAAHRCRMQEVAIYQRLQSFPEAKHKLVNVLDHAVKIPFVLNGEGSLSLGRSLSVVLMLIMCSGSRL